MMPNAEPESNDSYSDSAWLRTFDHTGLRILTGIPHLAGKATPACACVRARYFPSPLGEGYLYLSPVDYVRHCDFRWVPKRTHLYDVEVLVFPGLREARDLKVKTPVTNEPESASGTPNRKNQQVCAAGMADCPAGVDTGQVVGVG